MEKRDTQIGIRTTRGLKGSVQVQAERDNLTISEVGEVLFANYVSGQISIKRSGYKGFIVEYNKDVLTDLNEMDTDIPTEPEEEVDEPIEAVPNVILQSAVSKRTKSVNLNIRMTPEDRDALNAKARSEGFSTTKVIDILFENYLNGNIQIGKSDAKPKDTRSKTL